MDDDIERDAHEMIRRLREAPAVLLHAVATYLPPSQRSDALLIALLLDGRVRDQLVEQLLRPIPVEDRAGLVRPGVQLALDVVYDGGSVEPLASLLPFLPRSTVSEILQRIANEADAPRTDELLLALAASLPPEALELVTRHASNIADPGLRARLLLRLARRADGDPRTELLREVLAIASTTPDQAPELLREAAAVLPENLLAQALEIARRVPESTDRLDAMLALAARLSPEGRERLHERLLADVLPVADHEIGEKSVASIAYLLIFPPGQPPGAGRTRAVRDARRPARPGRARRHPLRPAVDVRR